MTSDDEELLRQLRLQARLKEKKSDQLKREQELITSEILLLSKILGKLGLKRIGVIRRADARLALRISPLILTPQR